MANQRFEELFKEISQIPLSQALRSNDELRVFIPYERLMKASEEKRRELNELADRDWRNEENPEYKGAWVRVPKL